MDVERLYADLEFIVIAKARAKSDILQRLNNLQKHGGVRINHDMSDFDALKVAGEIEVYSLLEDDLACSGMC